MVMSLFFPHSSFSLRVRGRHSSAFTSSPRSPLEKYFSAQTARRERKFTWLHQRDSTEPNFNENLDGEVRDFTIRPTWIVARVTVRLFNEWWAMHKRARGQVPAMSFTLVAKFIKTSFLGAGDIFSLHSSSGTKIWRQLHAERQSNFSQHYEMDSSTAPDICSPPYSELRPHQHSTSEKHFRLITHIGQSSQTLTHFSPYRRHRIILYVLKGRSLSF